MANVVSKRIRKSYIAPEHRAISFPRKEITRAVALADQGLREEMGPHRVVAWDIDPITLKALAETSFAIEAAEARIAEDDSEARLDGWAFESEEVAQELFRILKALRVTCWILEIHCE